MEFTAALVDSDDRADVAADADTDADADVDVDTEKRTLLSLVVTSLVSPASPPPDDVGEVLRSSWRYWPPSPLTGSVAVGRLGKGEVACSSVGASVTCLAGVAGAAGVAGLAGVPGVVGGVIAVTTLSTALSKGPASQPPQGIPSVPPALREFPPVSKATPEFLPASQVFTSGVEGVSQASPEFPSAPQALL